MGSTDHPKRSTNGCLAEVRVILYPSASGSRHRVDAAAYLILDFASRMAANESASLPERLRMRAAQSPVGTFETADDNGVGPETSLPERHPAGSTQSQHASPDSRSCGEAQGQVWVRF